MKKITILSLLSATILSQLYLSYAENTQQPTPQNTTAQQPKTSTQQTAQQTKQQTDQTTTQQTTQQQNQKNNNTPDNNDNEPKTKTKKSKSKVKYVTLSKPIPLKSLAKKYCMTPRQFITLNRLHKNTKMLEENKAYIVKDLCSTKTTKDKIPDETIEKEVDKITEEKKEEFKIKQPEQEEKNIKPIETKADQMAKILEPFSKPIEIEDNEGYKTVRISLRDINVIECPAGINSVVFSKEKGLITKTEKKAVFVKIPPIIKEDPEKGTQKIEYKDEPRDLFIECGNKIYSFVLIPEDVPAQKIIIKGKNLTKNDNQGNSQENSEEQSDLSSYEKEIISILKDIYLNGTNSQYDYKKLQEDIKKYKEIDIIPLRAYFTGKYIVKEYSIIAKEVPIELSEASFIHLSKYPVAIMLSKPKLSIKGESTSLFIVEKISEEQ
ncbi:MAG: type-F conjugative transfer system secretin TraK [Sulfurihydrogenibium sp.]|jgi:hypothetical protein|nr:type-F conjugative transfer system secretin TraK [Sulfurihydrogenibium sp.]